jgi:hypothetical protein
MTVQKKIQDLHRRNDFNHHPHGCRCDCCTIHFGKSHKEIVQAHADLGAAKRLNPYHWANWK